MRLFIRRFIGYFARIIFPTYSACGRCNRPWKIVKGHSTLYMLSKSCFPLCERCWGELNTFQRIPFYKTLWDEWELQGGAEVGWEHLKSAVIHEGFSK